MSIEISAVVEEAFANAKAATAEYVRQNGADQYPCGFAWVKFRPARGPLVAYLKSIKVGDTSYNGGYDIWNPSQDSTQAMYAKFAGAKAFADTMKSYGFDCRAECRLD